MEDEVFEKYFERIDCIFDSWFASTTNERKAKLKKTLEEIYQKAYDDCYEDFRTGKNLLVR